MSFKEGEDYYIEKGLYVFTEKYHLKRGYCCKSGCRHCPYGYMKKEKVAVSWSGGKDSALALYKLLKDDQYEVDHLFTVFDDDLKRVGLHGIPEHLVVKQAELMGIPLKKLYLKGSQSHSNYEEMMNSYLQHLNKRSVNKVIYGDIFLQDLKSYRDKMLKDAGVEGLYPLWQKKSATLVEEFLSLNFKTIICAGKEPLIRRDMVGKVLDNEIIESFPPEVDPAGENGEYHTFVFDGPIFKKPVPFQLGDKVEKTYEYKSINEDGKEILHVSKFNFQEIF